MQTVMKLRIRAWLQNLVLFVFCFFFLNTSVKPKTSFEQKSILLKRALSFGTVPQVCFIFHKRHLSCFPAFLHASSPQFCRVLVGPSHPGHPAVQRGRHLAGHGRLPVFRDADLPLGKFQVSRPPPGPASPFLMM